MVISSTSGDTRPRLSKARRRRLRHTWKVDLGQWHRYGFRVTHPLVTIMPSTEGAKPSPLSKLRRNKDTANASSNSLASGSGDGEGSSESQSGGGGGLRSSIDKVKQRTRRSIDDRRGSADAGTNRLSKLLPRRKRSAKPEDTNGLERELSTLSSADGTLGSLSVSGTRSDTSLFDDSGHSSLLTDDNSDVEGYVRSKSASPSCSSTLRKWFCH